MPRDQTHVPSTGEIVHYILSRSRKERPAIVTRHRRDGTIDLHVLTCANRGATSEPAFNALGVKRDRSATTPGTWHNVHEDIPEGFAVADVTPSVPATGAPAATAPAPRGVDEGTDE